MLGYRNKRQWLDMSDYVVHFTKDADGYNSMMRILAGQALLAGSKPFGIGGSAAPDLHRSVCLSEVPLHQLSRLVERRNSPFGIGFTKEFVAKNGGAPVWYVSFGSQQHEALKKLIAHAGDGAQRESDPIWSLTPFIDVTAKSPEAPYNYRFEWEREWRVVGALSFEPDDVAMLFLPEDLHDSAREFFLDVERDHIGPSYFCQMLDGTWSAEKINAALEKPIR